MDSLPIAWATVQFDNRTAVAAGAMATLSVAVLSVVLWQRRRTYAGFFRWTAGNICVALSLGFLTLRGIVPDLASVIGTNAAAFVGAVLLLEGMREFQGLPSTVWLARILAGLGLSAQIYFLVGVNDLEARILVASFCIGLLTAASAVTLFRGMGSHRKLGFLVAGSFFLLSAVGNFTPWNRGMARASSGRLQFDPRKPTLLRRYGDRGGRLGFWIHPPRRGPAGCGLDRGGASRHARSDEPQRGLDPI